MILPLPLLILVASLSLVISKNFNMTLLNNRYHHSNELYLCKSFRVNSNREVFITAFKPYADNNTHHMILYGCSESDNDELWDCGKFNSICANKNAKIIYAYALNANDLRLPNDVGFMVGGSRSNINYLVLQIHLLNGNNKIYSSHYGIEVSYEFRRFTKFAGVYLMAGLGAIGAHQRANIEIACRLHEDIDIHPFAYRTHTHRLGKLVSGFRVRNMSEWTLIGERDPIASPQAFYPTQIAPAETLRKNDILAARCVMDNYLDTNVYMGKSHKDEMCNFYLMYWTENRFLSENSCFFGDNDYFTKIGLENIPYSY